ncbi:MAG TPA: MlaD family protein [Thermoleophilaceae bacterium]|nr:MlaD family protein [Thermoleophilaceae bacterium]
MIGRVKKSGRPGPGISPFAVGLIAMVGVLLFAYFAYTKVNPLAKPYELHAIFESANNLGKRSPVRIAGVDVGKVTAVEPLDDGSGMAKVTMKIDDEGLPIHEDAELKVRSRLFLEGNYFVELRPGTPASPKAESGYTVPPNQTAFPVQFGQLLTALQTETREDLQTIFQELAKAYEGKGARGFNQAVKHWEEAYRTTSQVNDATLGTEEGDLGRVLKGQARVFGALSKDEEALANLVTDLNDTISGFARQEDNLRKAIPELRDVIVVGQPALASLNRALPEIRGFARDALPGARSSKATLDAQIPFIKQARRLVTRAEAGGLARDLRATIPDLHDLNSTSVRTFEQSRSLGRCQNRVLIPFSHTPIPDPAFPNHTGETFPEESPRAFVGLSGESRLSDANSPYFRTLAGAGPTTLVTANEAGERLFAAAPLPILGTRPPRGDRAPVFRPNQPCEIQEPPDLNAPAGPGDQEVEPAAANTPKRQERKALAKKQLAEIQRHLDAVFRGEVSLDPLMYSKEGLRIQARRQGLERTEDGGWRRKKDAKGGEAR